MNERWRNVAPLVALGAAGLALVAWLILRGSFGSSPLDAVPEDSFLVMTLDMAAIAESPLVDAFVGKDGKAGPSGKMLGMDAMTESCGFNPLTRIRAIAVAVPEGGETGDFGVIASGALTRDELTKCAQAMITKRGGEPKVGASGSFTVVEDARASSAANGASAPPKVAFRDGGPYLLGRGAWLDRMMATAEGRVASVEKNAGHASLRASLASRDGSAHALVVTAILPKALRDRLKSEMADERDDRRSDPSAPSAQAGAGTMGAVLGVSSAGLALRAGARSGSGNATTEAWIYAELRCETPASCEEVSKLLARKRFGWSRDFTLRFAGLGPGIDSFESHPDPDHASTLLVSTHLPGDALAGAIDYVLTPRARSRLPGGTSPSTPGPLPLVPSNTTPKAGAIPDEVIRPGNPRDPHSASDGSKPALTASGSSFTPRDAGASVSTADASATRR